MSFPPRLLLAAALTLLLGPATEGEPPDPKGPEIERLVKQLGSDSFEEREAASKRLVEIGEDALPALREAAAASPDAEVRRRAIRSKEDIADRLHEKVLASVKAACGKVRVDENSRPPEISINLTGKPFADSDLARLKWLRGLTELNLSETQVTDAGLAHLKGLPLSYLALSGSGVGDAGLTHLRGMRTLRTLDLSGTRVTDAGLASLTGLGGLYMLILSDTRVTDAGLVHLKGLEFHSLYLSGTKVTAKGMAQLKEALQPHSMIYGMP